MEVFDLVVPDDELSRSLMRVYRQNLVIKSCEAELHAIHPPKRLAKLILHVGTDSGIKTVQVLVKESSKYELIILSLLNKLLPYSCPRVILYKPAPVGMWVILENIATWIDIANTGMGETLVDGLFAIHAPFFGNTQMLVDNFKMIPTITERLLRASVSRALREIDDLCKNSVVAEHFTEWEKVRSAVERVLELPVGLDFPTTLVHGSYYPNTVRGLMDSSGNVHVVAYDWQLASIGWLQLDLALLLDRMDIIAKDRGLEEPSPALCRRYWDIISTEFEGVDASVFDKVYSFCYVCRVLPLIRWWARCFVDQPLNSGRAALEISTKFGRLIGGVNSVR